MSSSEHGAERPGREPSSPAPQSRLPTWAQWVLRIVLGLAGLAVAGIPFAGPDVVIVGDSVHDVLCGRSLGVRAVAVATGKTPPGRLAEVAPHAVLGDFTDTEAAVRAILGGEA